jgi:perosamine synthetase
MNTLHKLALHGGTPTRTNMLQYGKQSINEDDKQAIIDVVNSDYLTTGPQVVGFEEKMKLFIGCYHAIAVSNGTAALHMALYAANIKPGDEVITTAISFVATANSILYMNAVPIFCDINKSTMNIDVNKIESLITKKTKAILYVDFAGQSCHFEKLQQIKERYKLTLIQDASHSVGGYYNFKKNGAYADLTTFSFHPVKNMTTGEGGMVVTNNFNMQQRCLVFRNHGIDKNNDLHSFKMIDLGYNYRITDMQCALGISQLKRLPQFVKKRKDIAAIYDSEFYKFSDLVEPLDVETDSTYHIYVIKLQLKNFSVDRDTVFKALKAEGIGVNIHYLPIFMHPYYKKKFRHRSNFCPIAQTVYKQIITLPLFPDMTLEDVQDVITAVRKVIFYFEKK